MRKEQCAFGVVLERSAAADSSNQRKGNIQGCSFTLSLLGSGEAVPAFLLVGRGNLGLLCSSMHSVVGYSHLEQISTLIEITFSKSSQIFKFVCETHMKNKPAFFFFFLLFFGKCILFHNCLCKLQIFCLRGVQFVCDGIKIYKCRLLAECFKGRST